MNDEELEEVKKHYKLSDEKHKEKQEEINDLFFKGKRSVGNPRGVINIAPPGSGKTSANGYAVKEFKHEENTEDPNVVVINSDELKPFHPDTEEISKKFPKYFTQITDQDSNTWTSDLFDESLRRKYNVIFEGTGKNTRILDTMKDKMNEYKIDVRTMSVNELNCLISILERYWGQIDLKNWGRLVALDHFYQCYDNIPETIDVIERSGVPERVQVLKRGKTKGELIEIYDSKKGRLNRYPTAKYAILEDRQKDMQVAYEYFCKNRQKFEEKISREDVTSEELLIYNKILELVNEYEKKIKSNSTVSRDDDD